MCQSTLLFWQVGVLHCWKVCLRDRGSTEIGCEEKWLMERGEEIRFLTYRGDLLIE